MGRFIDDDPLSLAIAPPANETLAEKEARQFAELQARRISDQIDDQLRSEKAELKKRKKSTIKVLLLGQSESGKSSTLKNFQLTYAKQEWTQGKVELVFQKRSTNADDFGIFEERASWRSVIQLNLIRNVNDILDILSHEISVSSFQHTPDSEDDLDSRYSSQSYPSTKSSSLKSPSSSAKFSSRQPTPIKFSEKHQLLTMRLSPLRRVLKDLEVKLGAGTWEVYTTSVNTAAPFEKTSDASRSPPEFSINSRNGWKTALEKFRPRSGAQDAGRRTKSSSGDETTEIIASCREDMTAVREDPSIRDMLRRRKVALEDAPGFFLNDVERIAVPNYEPTDDDIVRARLRTLGVQEYRFVFDHGRTAGQEWLMYDVGGTRSSRAAWYPYFDDVTAIIFLAPISAFDEKLAEDRRVNRLEDSYLLWRSVCACKLLEKTQLILFLNKCDLLQAKLMRGVQIKKSVPSFGDRKNDLPTATRYFQQHFKEISKQYSPSPRPLFTHLTSVIDTRATAATLGIVEESILRDHLRRADLV